MKILDFLFENLKWDWVWNSFSIGFLSVKPYPSYPYNPIIFLSLFQILRPKLKVLSHILSHLFFFSDKKRKTKAKEKGQSLSFFPCTPQGPTSFIFFSLWFPSPTHRVSSRERTHHKSLSQNFFIQFPIPNAKPLLAQRPSTLVLMMINSCSYVY